MTASTVRAYTLATAGHVDHGKSTLVRALTGINPDRLKEEQERAMTIDLGFAWFGLPEGGSVGIVDVPGHEDFIENMLAGVGGIDGALLVIAADEGVMPQTREHAEILGLLGVDAGVVALTKVDLVDDDSWLPLVQDEAAEVLRAAGLPAWPMLPVSATSGQGLDELVRALARILGGVAPRPDYGRPRLSVDRVFTMEGFGTVVTGTLTDGCLAVGDEVVVGPGVRRARIRGLQTHKQKVPKAMPGGRVAVNLVGLDAQRLARGDVLMLPGSYAESSRLDVRIAMVPEGSAQLGHAQEVKAFHRSARRLGRVRLLKGTLLERGGLGLAQLELEAPLVAREQDAILLRRPSPAQNLGVATIIQVQARRRYRKRDAEALERLDRLAEGSEEQRLLQASKDLGPATVTALSQAAGLEPAAAEGLADQLLAQGLLLGGVAEMPEAKLVLSLDAWGSLWAGLEAALADYHHRFPLRQGMPREELRSKLGMDRRSYQFALELAFERQLLQGRGASVALAAFKPVPSAEQAQAAATLLRRLRQEPAAPPSFKDLRREVGDELITYLLEQEKLVQISPDVAFDADTYRWMVEQVRAAIASQGQLSVADVRDRFSTSRKYALALMEHLDAVGVTVRQGDVRVLKT